MDQQQQQQSTVTAGDNSKAMWEYEAPQYCDFSSADTFVDTDPTVDKFFRKWKFLVVVVVVVVCDFEMLTLSSSSSSI